MDGIREHGHQTGCRGALRIVAFWLLPWVVACASRSPVVRDVDGRPASSFAHREAGRSIDGRAIDEYEFGREGPTILILAAIHGDEPSSAHVAHELLAYLRRHEAARRGAHVVILPTVNPDGLAAGTRTNARRVDLNRNFPAKNWRPGPGRGPRRGSEPETRAIVDAIERHDPALIISIHSIGGGRQCNNYDGPGRRFAEVLSELNGYPAKASIGYPTPGSLGSWAGRDRALPTITLELPRDQPGPQAWRDNREALLALIRSTVAGR